MCRLTYLEFRWAFNNQQTQRGHDEAWGAFKYTGTVRFGDGLIILKRQPVRYQSPSETLANYGTQKNTEEHYHGVWVFEGYMHSRRVIVGRWYSTQDNAEDARLEGIFCLSKQPSARLRWINPFSASFTLIRTDMDFPGTLEGRLGFVTDKHRRRYHMIGRLSLPPILNASNVNICTHKWYIPQSIKTVVQGWCIRWALWTQVLNVLRSYKSKDLEKVWRLECMFPCLTVERLGC